VGRLVVGGSAAVHGVLIPGRRGLTGTIGHRRVRVSYGELGEASVSPTSLAKAMIRWDAL
jgi:predicted NBD/HSP70 family sugar kinase